MVNKNGRDIANSNCDIKRSNNLDNNIDNTSNKDSSYSDNVLSRKFSNLDSGHNSLHNIRRIKDKTKEVLTKISGFYNKLRYGKNIDKDVRKEISDMIRDLDENRKLMKDCIYLDCKKGYENCEAFKQCVISRLEKIR